MCPWKCSSNNHSVWNNNTSASPEHDITKQRLICACQNEWWMNSFFILLLSAKDSGTNVTRYDALSILPLIWGHQDDGSPMIFLGDPSTGKPSVYHIINYLKRPASFPNKSRLLLNWTGAITLKISMTCKRFSNLCRSICDLSDRCVYHPSTKDMLSYVIYFFCWMIEAIELTVYTQMAHKRLRQHVTLALNSLKPSDAYKHQ